ncbi:MAG: hypothetical protein ACFFCS_16835 [Candidatus Hodarchaeota archaeon]
MLLDELPGRLRKRYLDNLRHSFPEGEDICHVSASYCMFLMIALISLLSPLIAFLFIFLSIVIGFSVIQFQVTVNIISLVNLTCSLVYAGIFHSNYSIIKTRWRFFLFSLGTTITLGSCGLLAGTWLESTRGFTTDLPSLLLITASGCVTPLVIFPDLVITCINVLIFTNKALYKIDANKMKEEFTHLADPTRIPFHHIETFYYKREPGFIKNRNGGWLKIIIPGHASRRSKFFKSIVYRRDLRQIREVFESLLFWERFGRFRRSMIQGNGRNANPAKLPDKNFKILDGEEYKVKKTQKRYALTILAMSAVLLTFLVVLEVIPSTSQLGFHGLYPAYVSGGVFYCVLVYAFIRGYINLRKYHLEPGTRVQVCDTKQDILAVGGKTLELPSSFSFTVASTIINNIDRWPGADTLILSSFGGSNKPCIIGPVKEFKRFYRHFLERYLLLQQEQGNILDPKEIHERSESQSPMSVAFKDRIVNGPIIRWKGLAMRLVFGTLSLVAWLHVIRSGVLNIASRFFLRYQLTGKFTFVDEEVVVFSVSFVIALLLFLFSLINLEKFIKDYRYLKKKEKNEKKYREKTTGAG